MKRQTEPELMEDEIQVLAYSRADFESAHQDFIERLKHFVGDGNFSGTALDLGCGSGDITRRFALAYPYARIQALDGSKPMLDEAKRLIEPDLQQRITFIHGLLQDVTLPQSGYEIIYANSLLHHLTEPLLLWRFIKSQAKPGARVVVMDLLRPDTQAQAQSLVSTYAADEPDILQQDFYHSLLAAFTVDEIKAQLKAMGLSFCVEQTSDRHVFITGLAP